MMSEILPMYIVMATEKLHLKRKSKLKELFEVVQSFAQVQTVSARIDWIECFKFALEQYGVENANNFLTEETAATDTAQGTLS